MKRILTGLALCVGLGACQPNGAHQGASAEDAEKPRLRYRLVTLEESDIENKQELRYKGNWEVHQYLMNAMEAKVNAAIAEGWQPIGGLTTAAMGPAGMPVQAMVRSE